MRETEEEWRDIAGFPYEVSSLGRVRRTTQGGSGIAKAGRFLKLAIDKGGYRFVTLSLYGVPNVRKVHTLVCTAFNGAPPVGKIYVRHLDGCPWHNWPGNLAWGTHQDNADDRGAHGRQPKGEKSPRAKLTEKIVKELRVEYALALRGRQIAPRGWPGFFAKKFGLHPVTVSRICTGKRWAHSFEAYRK